MQGFSEHKFKELLKLFCADVGGEPIIGGQALSQTTVYNDGWLGYDGLLLSGFKHRSIHHRQNELARGKNPSTGSSAFGATPCFASSSCVAFVRSSSFSISRNRNGAGIIDSIIYSSSYSKTSA
jgi:hypothetical protein